LRRLPLDFSKIAAGGAISLQKYEHYTRISPLITSGKGQFLLWQNRDTDTFPRIVSANDDEPRIQLDQSPLRLPLRSAQAMDGKLLLLDTAGNLSVLPYGAEQSRPFTFSSIGSMDAAFIDRNNVILCRSVISGSAPFLKINITTGETVSLPWPSQAGVMAYSGGSGSVYAVTIEQDNTETYPRTSIIRLNTSAPAQSVRIAEYLGEDIQFSMAEANNTLAATIGGSGAALYLQGDVQKFESTPGFPVQLCGGGRYFISLDAESAVCWHDARTGKLLALFRLYRNDWVLHTENRVVKGLRAGG
jgi:hypothetical protein